MKWNGWDAACHKCGETVIQHVVYHDEAPVGATEAEFDNRAIRGFYCRTKVITM